MSGRLRAAVVGAGGFTGKECLRLLAAHPGIEVAALLSARAAGPRGDSSGPGRMREPRIEDFDPSRIEGLDLVFLCAPHEVAADLAPELLERARCVIDLSAAHRLRDPGAYPEHYGFAHPHPELLEEAVLGLTEHARPNLPGARLVANPGCYVTAVCLPLLPLLDEGLCDPGSDLIADCKSGQSGAGKTSGPASHFAAVQEDFRAYAVGAHRHEPEIRQVLGRDRIYFTPHLLPVFRGILATIHLRPAPGRNADDLREALKTRYETEPFLEICAPGILPSLADVRRTNLCRIAVEAHGDRVVLVSVLDNLVKGAAGQAVQNANAVFGLPEDEGLPRPLPGLEGWT